MSAPEVSTNVRTFVDCRLQEVEARYAELEAEMAPIRLELLELRRARAALDGRSSPRQSRTLQSMAMSVLEASQAPMPTMAILMEINAIFGRDIARESLAPQLSRLRQKGRILKTDLGYSPASAALLAQTEASDGR